MHASLHLPKNELYKFGTYSRINGNIHASEMHCIFSLARSWLRQTLYLLSLLTIKAPTHTHWHAQPSQKFHTKHRERERERERMSGEEKVVCVTGASGYIASWLVKHLLQRGYTVKATVRDTSQCLSLSLQFVSTCYYELKLHALF